MAKSTEPTQLTIRSYQVGFGDCFLLTFHYPDGDRHVLIDFGSTGEPKQGAPAKMMDAVAADIEQESGAKLTAVVATHRHKDHISGFAIGTGKQKGKATGDVIRRLKPELVVQPWTEDPKAKRDAKKPAAPPDGSQGLVRALTDMSAFAQQVVDEARTRKAADQINRSVAEEISFIGDDGLANLLAVKNLMTMGKKQEYVFYGSHTDLNKLLPGVKVTVLGPPTLEQAPAAERERSKDASEFWHFQAAAQSHAAAGQLLFPRAPHSGHGSRLPDYARWFAPRLEEIRGEQLLQLVRAMDDALNNTSVILLFEAGGKKFLFPGDAQIENWSYALKDVKEFKDNQATLAGVDFYKVGHHGSLNATPKTLWGLFKKKSPKKTQPGRLSTAVSTMGGKHGSVASRTEVPRGALIDELERQSNFYCTEDLVKERDPSKRLRIDIVFPL
jgi:hypothetical protein